MTMLVVTHEMGFARNVGTRLIFMDQGSVVEDRVPAAFFTEPSSDRAQIVNTVAEAAQRILGAKPAINMRVGASDARLYRLFDVPSVVFGPTPYNMGGPDEHVRLDELLAVAKVHALAGFRFLQEKSGAS
jgi:acetylornithine deacetylase/succinyl-diaminopimelate desuccinylase-like protein